MATRDVSPDSSRTSITTTDIDLGIIELDNRLEFTLDPLAQMLATSATPADQPPNTNCGGVCNTHWLC